MDESEDELLIATSCLLPAMAGPLFLPRTIFLLFFAPSFYSFLTPCADTKFQGFVKYTWVGENCDFRLKSPFISETVRDRPMVAMER